MQRRIPGQEEPFALWEWLEALDARPADVDAILVDTPAKIELAVSRAAQLVAEHLPNILAAERGVVARMEAARTAREEADMEEQTRQAQAAAVDDAANAFRVGDFKRVVSLLEPFESRLPPGQVKKLHIARERRAR